MQCYGISFFSGSKEQGEAVEGNQDYVIASIREKEETETL